MEEPLRAFTGMMLVATICALGPGVGAAAPPALRDEATSRVSLTFDVAIVEPELGARLEQQLAERLGPVLAGEDLRVVSAAEAPDRSMNVRIIAFDEEQRDYDVELQMTGEGADATLPVIRCEACNERRLVEKVIENTPRLVELHDMNREPVTQNPSSGASPAGGPSPGMPMPLIGKLGFSGVGLMGVGVTALASGAYLLGRDIESANTAQPWVDIRDFRPAGAATLVAGFVVTGLGATLLALDLVGAHKARPPRLALRLSPSYVGFQIQQQF
jgi:hypothetical protein